MAKKLILSLLLAVVFVGFAVGGVQAQQKIAVVSLQQALNEVDEGKKIKNELRKEYEDKKSEIDAMKKDLEKLSKDLDKQKMVLSAEALDNKKRDLQTKFIDLQNKAVTFERELKTKEAESAKKILTRLRDIVVALAKKEGYTLVIENSMETVLYSSNAEDITPKVIAAYNKKN